MRFLIVDESGDFRRELAQMLRARWPQAQMDEWDPRQRGNPAGTLAREAYDMVLLDLHPAGQDGIFAIAGDTDGIDGAEEVAGALVDPTTLARARLAGHDPVADLMNNDAHTLFKALDDQVVTGPTLTNVNDFRAILVRPQVEGAR